jgi:DNA invertase Pin-like site-specific DNA recombinase
LCVSKTSDIVTYQVRRFRVKIVGYVRVSTATQVEDGFGLDVQKAAVRAWCKANGHKLIAILSDEGISGAKELEDRPGLADAIEALHAKRAQGIVVPRLDRLARDLIVQETVLAEIRRIGGEVFSTSPAEASYLTDDPDDPSRKMIRQVLGAVSEYERSMVVLRLRNGRRRKAQMGGYASGAPAFGYEARDGDLVELEEEQVTVKRICDLRASGASLRAICSILESEGHRSKRGGTGWQPMGVKRVLDRLGNAA